MLSTVMDTTHGRSTTWIPDAGHCPQFENPEAWWKALTGYLAIINL